MKSLILSPIFILCAVLFSSCSYINLKTNRSESPSKKPETLKEAGLATSKKTPEKPEDLAPKDLQRLLEARSQLETRKSQEALEQFSEIEKSSGSEIAKIRAQLGQAEALVGLGKYEIAMNKYKAVIEKSIQLDPETASTALLRSSLCYEKMGMTDVAYVSLQNAQLHKRALPFEQREIELPFRFAAVSLSLGRRAEAQNYLKRVDENLLPFLDVNGSKSNWLGSILFQIGQIGTSPQTFEEFQNSALQFRAVQKHYLRCMELNQSPWSELCSQQSQKGFFDIFNFVHTFQGESFADPFVTYRNTLEKKVLMSIDLKSLILYTQSLRSLDDQVGHPQANDFFLALEKLQARVDDFLFSTPETSALTEDSQRLNSVKRKGRFKNEP